MLLFNWFIIVVNKYLFYFNSTVLYFLYINATCDCVDISHKMINVKSGFILQSSEALEFLKRDLTEFSTVVQHDTTCSIVATANAVRSKLVVSYSRFLEIIFYLFYDTYLRWPTLYKCLFLFYRDMWDWFPLLEQTEGSSETTEKLKKSISGFLGVISETLAPPPDKTIDCDVITLMATPTGTTEVYDSSKVTSLIAVDTNKTLVLSVIFQKIEMIHENNNNMVSANLLSMFMLDSLSC